MRCFRIPGDYRGHVAESRPVDGMSLPLGSVCQRPVVQLNKGACGESRTIHLLGLCFRNKYLQKYSRLFPDQLMHQQKPAWLMPTLIVGPRHGSLYNDHVCSHGSNVEHCAMMGFTLLDPFIPKTRLSFQGLHYVEVLRTPPLARPVPQCQAPL